MRYVAAWLSGIIVAVFALQLVFSTGPFLLINSLKFAEPWRLLTSIFAHANAAHLLGNLFALLLFGLILEGRIGPRKTLFLFLSTGIIVNIFSPYPSSLGASGAIYGILGALIALRPFMTVYVSYFPMPMVLAGVIWLAQDLFGVFFPSGVANLAHISGMFIGLGYGIYLRPKFGDRISLPKLRKKDPILEKQLDDFEDRYMR